MPTSRGIAGMVIRSSAIVATALVWSELASAGAGPHSRSGISLKYGAGVYYPAPFYSRQYLRQFRVDPRQVSLYPRLVPFQNYAGARLGLVTPNLADGKIHADRFSYRYDPRFVPPRIVSAPTIGNRKMELSDPSMMPRP